MKIRKLELQGFKSFADRVALHFGPGISGVVGPNGCGKSNIVDAVRWCIGEQSAKSLRGDAMSDVIFAGTAKRQGVGFAEVGLTFVATDEPFPGIWARFTEIEVTRKLYKDGSSEYGINGERVRLRDITDLFLDTGVGNRLYSFIEQGRIGQIVHARPHDRRALIEEAAGISRYKLRREESLEKLAQTRQALEKVADLHEELGRGLKSAEKQVQRALRAQALSAKLRQEELALALGRFGGLVADRKVLNERVRTAQSELDEAVRAVARHEEDLEQRRKLAEAAESAAGRLRDELTAAEGDRKVEDSARQYQDRESGLAQARVVQLERDLEDQRKERDSASAEATSESAAAVEAEHGLANVRGRATEAGQRLQAAHALATQARQRLEAAKRAAQVALEASVRARGQLAGIAARKQELAARESRHQKALADVVPARAAEELARVKQALSQAESEAAGAREAIETKRREASGFESARAAAITSSRAADSALTDATREREKLSARLESLEAMESRDVDLPDGVKAALKEPDVVGLVGRSLSFPEAIEAQVARALDGALDAVIVPDVATAKRVAAKAANARLRVLCLELAQPEPLQGASTSLPASLEGQKVVSALLPHLELVASLDEAFALWKPGKTIVTAQGVLLRRDGLLVLGAESGTALASVRRRREIAEVRTKVGEVPITERQQAVAVAKAAVLSAEAALAAHAAGVEALRSEARQGEAAVGEARHKVREVEAEVLRASRAAEALAKEAEQIVAAGELIRADQERLESDASKAELRHAEGEQALRAEQVALESIEPGLIEAQELSQRLRFEAESLQTAAIQRAAAAQAARSRAERAERRVAQVAQERSDVDARLIRLGLEQAATLANLQALGERIGEVASQLDVARLKAAEEKLKVKAEESASRSARDRRDAAKDKHVEVEGLLTRARAEIEGLLGQAEEKHGLSLPALLDRVDRDGAVLVSGWEPEPPELALGAEAVPTLRLDAGALDLDDLQVVVKTKAVESLREQRFKIGETNAEAIGEYHMAKAQFDDIDRQRIDLERAMELIESALGKLNQTCRERFRETFDLVNEHFAEMYPKLVGGGAARLELTDDEDVLACGVEMMVQPPGKKVQHLALLSGGEKAMAAIGLIFSLFRVKPSPFCLLDEVDAPLDEGNGARFNDMLRQMALRSQFIVITHNKKTMEAADVLYGVTMPEPGASRLVTVRLEGG